jgi:ABC-type Zn uptake system ZnuABC Zn-binding protein ZnuA
MDNAEQLKNTEDNAVPVNRNLLQTFLPMIGALALAAVAPHASAAPTSSPRTKVSVVATIMPLADWVRNVGGDEVEVTTLIAPGMSPHTYEPGPADLRRIAESQLFVSVGLGLDNWAARLSRSNRSGRSLAVGERLRLRGLIRDEDGAIAGTTAPQEAGNAADAGRSHATHSDRHDHDHAGPDPHFWLDPTLAREAVSEIAAALTEVAPDRADLWRQRADAYNRQLEALDREIAGLLAPCKGRQIVTFHNAFGYFARRYGLAVGGVIEESPGKQPSERSLKQLVETLRQAGTNTIFSEPQLDSRVARILAQEVGAKVSVLDPEGTGQRQSYVSLMRFNARQIKEALCPNALGNGLPTQSGR